MSKCKYNYNTLMPKTRKNLKSEKGKIKNKKTKDLEDLLEEEELEDLESDSDSHSDSDSDSGSESDTSISKELNKMMNETIDSDLTMPAIGLGLIAIIGFALYKGIKV